MPFPRCCGKCQGPGLILTPVGLGAGAQGQLRGSTAESFPLPAHLLGKNIYSPIYLLT